MSDLVQFVTAVDYSINRTLLTRQESIFNYKSSHITVDCTLLCAVIPDTDTKLKTVLSPNPTDNLHNGPSSAYLEEQHMPCSASKGSF